jgi:hypothetical protein
VTDPKISRRRGDVLSETVEPDRRVGGAVYDVRDVSLSERLGGDYLFTVERAAAELQAHPAGHVGRGKADTAGR